MRLISGEFDSWVVLLLKFFMAFDKAFLSGFAEGEWAFSGFEARHGFQEIRMDWVKCLHNLRIRRIFKRMCM